jgi:Rhodopirellula transposase DDE domain
VTGLARDTIAKGIAELRSGPPLAVGRVRRPGGGRKKVEVIEPAVLSVLQEVVEAATGGSPEDARRWTAASKAKLAAALAARGYPVSPNTVGRRLRDERGSSLQANRKDQEGRAPPGREAPFRYLNAQAQAFLARGQPVISVDPKKQALVGAFKNGGRTWRPTGDPVRVSVHDFPSQSHGKAIPSGVDDGGHNRGFVNVGTSHDPADFAVQSSRLWWEHEGRARSRTTDALLVFADSGGSNSARSRRWKLRLRTWRTTSSSPSPCATCRRAPASGTRSSTASSPSSASTGGAAPWSTTTPWSASSAPQPPRPASSSPPAWIWRTPPLASPSRTR